METYVLHIIVLVGSIVGSFVGAGIKSFVEQKARLAAERKLVHKEEAALDADSGPSVGATSTPSSFSNVFEARLHGHQRGYAVLLELKEALQNESLPMGARVQFAGWYRQNALFLDRRTRSLLLRVLKKLVDIDTKLSETQGDDQLFHELLSAVDAAIGAVADGADNMCDIGTTGKRSARSGGVRVAVR